MLSYLPEGFCTQSPYHYDLTQAMHSGEILQSTCIKCDEFLNLHIRLGHQKGIIPREETALGIADGSVTDYAILSRVGKPVCFQVLTIDHNGTAILSRRSAQEKAQKHLFASLEPGDVVPAVVQNAAPFGVFCDIGCGIIALMRINRCCISRLQNTGQLYYPGQKIRAVVYHKDMSTGRFELTGRELLGTWEENAKQFRQGQSVTGIIRSIMPYGIFIELTPNLSGLAEYTPGFASGDHVSVYIRSIQSQKHKIKLTILNRLPYAGIAKDMPYFLTSGHINKWEYYEGSKAVTYF